MQSSQELWLLGGSMASAPIMVSVSVPGTGLASSLCQRNRNGLDPGGRRDDENLGKETPVLVWVEGPCPGHDDKG